jgi:hypothetical protein
VFSLLSLEMQTELISGIRYRVRWKVALAMSGAVDLVDKLASLHDGKEYSTFYVLYSEKYSVASLCGLLRSVYSRALRHSAQVQYMQYGSSSQKVFARTPSNR